MSFALPASFPERPREAVVEVETIVGSLLLARGDLIAQVLARDQMWEIPETRWFLSTLQAGQTFVDVGAHVGYFSVLASKRVGPNGSVIAVEPESRNLDLLRRNLVRNGCTNSAVVPFAAAAAPGWMSLALDEQNRGAHRLVPLGEADSAVRCVRLDDVLPPKVDFVKIDAQGYDHEIVEGLQRTLSANPNLVVLAEISANELRRRRVDPASVLARYEALGLTLSLFDERRELQRVTVDEALAVSAERDSDISVVLSRTGRPKSHPARVGGLDIEELPDGLIVRDPRAGRLHRLNSTATAVFDLCTGENSVAAIIELVREKYSLPHRPAAEVERCVNDLRSANLVD